MGGEKALSKKRIVGYVVKSNIFNKKIVKKINIDILFICQF